MNGKGDKRRPQSVSNEQFASNWDTIFSGKPNANMFDDMNLDPKEENVKEEKKETEED